MGRSSEHKDAAATRNTHVAGHVVASGNLKDLGVLEPVVCTLRAREDDPRGFVISEIGFAEVEVASSILEVVVDGEVGTLPTAGIL